MLVKIVNSKSSPRSGCSDEWCVEGVVVNRVRGKNTRIDKKKALTYSHPPSAACPLRATSWFRSEPGSVSVLGSVTV